jgi:hypothetical protein
MPAGAAPPAITPVLSVYTAPCGRTATGAATAPPAGTPEYQMFGDGQTYGGPAPGDYTPHVCVLDETARDINGQVVPTFTERQVTDDVFITEASWNAGTLTVKATSSSGVKLRLAGFGELSGALPMIAVSAAVPPAEVTVLFDLSGSTKLAVKTGVVSGGGPGTGAPVAANDDVVVNEDAAIDIDVLANDAWDGHPDPWLVSVNIVGAPQLGIATVAADKKVHYAPFLNANGSIAYSITVGGVTSALAYIAIAITPFNDPPVAVNDVASGVVNQPVAINMIANDTDVDGATDLANAVIVAEPTPTDATATPWGSAASSRSPQPGPVRLRLLTPPSTTRAHSQRTRRR